MPAGVGEWLSRLRVAPALCAHPDLLGPASHDGLHEVDWVDGFGQVPIETRIESAFSILNACVGCEAR